MIVKCEIVKSLFEMEGEKSTVYGFEFYNGKVPNESVRIIEDVFTSESMAIWFRDMVNRNDLDAIHIDDVIEDALCF